MIHLGYCAIRLQHSLKIYLVRYCELTRAKGGE